MTRLFFIARCCVLITGVAIAFSPAQRSPAAPRGRAATPRRVASAAPPSTMSASAPDLRELDVPMDATDPFYLVRKDLKRMKRSIKELVEGTLDDSSSSSHPLLQEAAREFFERRERAFRPTIVILAARALQTLDGGKLKPKTDPVFMLQCQLAEIVEMMSTAQARANADANHRHACRCRLVSSLSIVFAPRARAHERTRSLRDRRANAMGNAVNRSRVGIPPS